MIHSLRRIISTLALLILSINTLTHSVSVMAQDRSSLRNSQSGAIRYELGRRTRILEQAWIDCNDAKRRMVAVPQVNTAVMAFFSSKADSVARSLAKATATLQAEEQSPAQTWADALHVSIGPRLVSTDTAQLSVQLDWLYEPSVERPDMSVRLSMNGDDADLTALSLSKLPLEDSCDLPATDQDSDDRLTVTIADTAGSAIRQFEVGISRIHDVAGRLHKISSKLEESSDDKDLQVSTARYLTKLLTDRAAGVIHETDYPAAKLLQDAESLVGSDSEAESTAGEYYVAVPAGERTVAVRVLAPKADPNVVVVALHGAGGTENMFFEAYGNGMIADLCRERGWTLISPGHRGPRDDVWQVIEAAESVVGGKPKFRFMVGHSMGAMTALSLGQQHPERLQGLAAVSGGGAGDLKKLASLPVFLSAGNYDFGLSGTKAAAAALKKLDAPVRVEYYDSEHLLIVPDALPDIFGWFDDIAAGQSE